MNSLFHIGCVGSPTSSQTYLVNPHSPHSSSTPSLPGRVFGIAAVILLSLGSVASAAPLQRKYDGGYTIIQPNFSSLVPLKPEFGPFYSDELRCFSKTKELDLPKFLYISNPFLETCSSSIENAAEEYSRTVTQDIPVAMQPYCKAVKKMSPTRNKSVAKFPENFSAFLYNELGLIENGNKGCILKDQPSDYFVCKKNVDVLLKSIKIHGQEKSFNSKVFREKPYRTKGFMYGYKSNSETKKIHFGMNPEVHTNYKNAIKVMESNFLEDNCFFRKKPEEITGFIQNLHRVLLANIPANQPNGDSEITPGVFRKSEIIVFKEEQSERSLEGLIARLSELGTTKRELQVFKKSFSKLQTQGPSSKVLSKAELKIWNRLVYFAPEPDQIETLMSDFAVNFKHYAMQEIHPIALAAWTHCEIGRIHPFSDGNGRLARLLTNAILIRGGYEPVIFFDDELYTNAVNEDELSPGTFATYLAGLIKKQAKGPQFLMRV